MRVVRRIGLLLLVLVLLAVIAVGGVLAYITGRALPQTTGTLRVPGLAGPVSVVRDVNGIAQIVADTPHDLFLAQGYVHAQDRFWQMEVWRHIGAGRLSELFGESQLDTDKFIRTLGWRQAGQRDLDAASPELRAVLQAYADGVNAWLAANHDRLGLAAVVTGLKSGLGSGLAGYDPEPWTPLDSATWALVQAWNLGGNYDSELFRTLADARLGDPARTDQLFPGYGADAPVIVPAGLPGSAGAGVTGPTFTTPSGGSASTTGATAAGADATAVSATSPAIAAGLGRLAAIGGSIARVAGLDAGSGLGGHGIGSNDWVVGASKSATGRPLLANDPHLGVSMPSVWYLNGLHCRVVGSACPFDVVGVSFPGDPLVILGHNARIAWGATNIGPDVQDLFLEKADPADPSHYLFKGASLPFTVRTEAIKVAGGDPVTLQVRETGHGPILNGVVDDLKDAPDLYALRWTALTETNGAFDAFLELDKAGDFTAFRAALRHFGAPAQNFVYADVVGHIGYQAPGIVPIRADPADTGDRPVPGWDGKHEWVGAIPYDDLPRVYDPPSGFIVTANNALVDAKYPYHVASDWDPGYRAQRILDRLASAAGDDGGVTVAEMSAIQTDTKVLRAARIVPSLARIVPATADGRTILDRIRAWDGTCPIDSQGCAAYMAFEEQALRGLFDDDLGPVLAARYTGSELAWQSLIALLANPRDHFWDDTATTDRVETEADILARALDGAGRELRATLGNDRQWTWGVLHTATFREQTLGESGIGPLEWYFDRGPEAVPGAAGAVNNTYYRYDVAYPDPTDPAYRPADLRGVFEMTNMPSYRLDVDMGALDGARVIQTTGQSGNPFDRHYGDLVVPWIRGLQVPLPFSSAAVSRAAAAVLTLTP